MLFILFWTLTVQFTWQSMGQSQASWFSSKYLKQCSKNEQSFYGFGTTWGDNDKIFILGWSIPLINSLSVNCRKAESVIFLMLQQGEHLQ